MEIKRNVVALVEGNQKKCGGWGEKQKCSGGGAGARKTIEMWWWYIASLFKKLCSKNVECGVDVGSMWWGENKNKN